MNEANKTTVWTLTEGGEVFKTDVEGHPDPCLLEAALPPGAVAYYVSGLPERPAWARARAGHVAHPPHHDAPVEAREACALWLPGWAGRHCAEEWHRESPAPVAGETAFERLRIDYGDHIARGDVDYLRDATWRLLGREPSETERRAFGEALLERLFELTPVASDGEVAA